MLLRKPYVQPTGLCNFVSESIRQLGRDHRRLLPRV